MHLVLCSCIVSGRRTTRCTWNCRRRWCGALKARSLQCEAQDEHFTERDSTISVHHLIYNTCLWYLGRHGGSTIWWRGVRARGTRRFSCSCYKRSRRPPAAPGADFIARACQWPWPPYLTGLSGWYHRRLYPLRRLKKNKFCYLKKSFKITAVILSPPFWGGDSKL